VNYRGYGESEGKPGEKELLEDALVIHDYAVRRPEVDSGRIVAMGRSLGSGVAVHLAAHRPLRASYSCRPTTAWSRWQSATYPFLPGSRSCSGTASIRSPRVPQIEAPLLVPCCDEDRVITGAHSRALFEAWRGAKTWHEVPRSDQRQHRR